TACWLALRPRTTATRGAHAARPGDEDDGLAPDEVPAPASAPSGLPWGVALLAGGIAVETWAHGWRHAVSLLPGTFASGPAGALRAGALLLVFGPLTWLVGVLAAVPLTR